jgi:hypothetical protein
MFDIKFEYGFREQAKTKKLRGGKVIKKREKKECINIGGGGAKDKIEKPKNKRQRTKMEEEVDEDVPEEPVIQKIVEKVSMEELMGQMTN